MTEDRAAHDATKIAQAAKHVEATIEAERQDAERLAEEGAREDEFKPGEPDYDGLHAMAALFRICTAPDAGRLPADLIHAVAEMGDAFIRADADIEEIKEESDRQAAARAERQKNEEELGQSEHFTIRITGINAEPINVGPYAYRFQTEKAASYFRGAAAAFPSAEVEVRPYDDSVPHIFGQIADSASELAEMFDDDQVAFPSLLQRVVALHGEAGRKTWAAAERLYNLAPDYTTS
jgi:hypothetical protein